MSNAVDTSGVNKVRLDKWLWAARFFKTRSLAKQAIEGGKVYVNGARSKSSREIETGMHLTIRQGWDEIIVVVIKLADKRGSAPQAAQLYEETPDSTANREQQARQRQAQRAMMPVTDGRPTKQDRRKIHRFKRDNLDS